MAMTTFESTIKHIAHPQETVYRAVSDLSNLEKIRSRIPADQVEKMSFTQDEIAVSSPVGTISMRIIDREPPKTVKFETSNSPVPFNLWIQLVAMDEQNCKMKLTIKAELNMFIKGIVSKPLQEALEKIADALAMVPYDQLAD